jgi:sulfatase modifying factor 1
MGATPVTWGMWKEYRQSFSVPGKGVKLPMDPGWGYPDDHPVVNVSWEDIMDPGGFCEWASSKAGFKLTLPTDAQWEYAARGGKDGLEYPWGNEFDSNRVWGGTEILGIVERVEKTGAVDRGVRIYRNRYGLTDMAGNVIQWCADYFNQSRPFGKDPIDHRESKYRCVRGDSYDEYGSINFRCAQRGRLAPHIRNYTLGFRLSAGPK